MCPKSRWTILNTTEPCFGAKGNKPARFTIKWEGFLAAFKIVHTKGEVNCDTRQTKHSFASKWGCLTKHPKVDNTPLGTFITTSPPSRRILFPREKFIPNKSPTMWYALPGFHPDSPFLVFHDFANPEFVQYGQEVEIWYGEDLQGVSEDDNDGKSCVEVFAWYLWIDWTWLWVLTLSKKRCKTMVCNFRGNFYQKYLKRTGENSDSLCSIRKSEVFRKLFIALNCYSRDMLRFLATKTAAQQAGFSEHDGLRWRCCWLSPRLNYRVKSCHETCSPSQR